MVWCDLWQLLWWLVLGWSVPEVGDDGASGEWRAGWLECDGAFPLTGDWNDVEIDDPIWPKKISTFHPTMILHTIPFFFSS